MNDLKLRLLSLLVEADNLRERLAAVDREARDLRNLIGGMEMQAAHSAPDTPARHAEGQNGLAVPEVPQE